MTIAQLSSPHKMKGDSDESISATAPAGLPKAFVQ